MPILPRYHHITYFIGLPRDPKMCTSCERLFCSVGIDLHVSKRYCLSFNLISTTCPFRCQNATYVKPPKILKRTIDEMKIHCKKCNAIVTVENIDKHETVCQRPKCGCPDCTTLEESMKHTYKVLLSLL